MARDFSPIGLPPLMVDQATAAALCSMSSATYAKYAQQGLLPRLNAAGRVSVEAIRLAARRLDGIRELPADDPDAALTAWEAERGHGQA